MSRQACNLYQRNAHGQHAHVFGGHDPGMCAYTFGAQIACILGHADEFIRKVDQALALARDLAHPPTIVGALVDAADIRVFRREPLAVEEILRSLLPLVSKYGSAVGVANAKMLLGWTMTSQGRTGEGLAELRLGLQAWRASGSTFWAVYRLGRAADAFRMAGHADEALTCITDAAKAIESRGDRWFEAEIHRMRGELLLSGGDQQRGGDLLPARDGGGPRPKRASIRTACGKQPRPAVARSGTIRPRAQPSCADL